MPTHKGKEQTGKLALILLDGPGLGGWNGRCSSADTPCTGDARVLACSKNTFGGGWAVETGSLRGLCKLLAGLSILAGLLGMPMSFLYLASASMADITAGTSGFVAGAILIGSGIISLSLLASSEAGRLESPRFPEERTEHGIMKREL
jgi:hypothetical protein